MTITFRCQTCGEMHSTLPAWHFELPMQAVGIAPAQRATRVALNSDECVIDARAFYVKGLLEVPVQRAEEPFTWGVWLSVSAASYQLFAASLHDEQRAPMQFFGWLCNSIPGFPETQLLKTMVHVRAYPWRPYVELEPTEHPLAAAQRDGLLPMQAIAMAESLLHSKI